MAEPLQTPALPLGVNLAGYLDATLGIGESARNIAAALQAAGVSVARLGLSSRDAPRSGGAAPADEAAHRVTLVCANPDAMTGARDELGAGAFDDRHVIGLWWWEVAALPGRWLRAFDLVDEVWAGSRFVADVFAAVAPVPVVHLPLPVPEPVASPAGREALGLPRDRFLFGFVYDYASVAARKNPLGLIDAFARAFAGDEGAALVLKTLGGEQRPAEHAAVLAAAAAHPAVTVIEEHMSAGDKNALIRALDCYVSLHRSEGFGLTIAEAMLLGTPVIASDYGGSRDFVSAFNALLVDARPVPIGTGNDPYPADGEWAEPDLDHAAACMRAVRADPPAARARARRARADVLARHSPAVAGRAMAQRLARVMQLPLDGAGRTSALDLGAVRERMATGPKAAPGAARGARAAVRDGALRAMRPYTVHQRLVDEELLRALQSLDERVRGLASGQQALAAELARLRRDDGG
ncbi:MAG: glycosyltransferase family 4 protein [Actinobacteria bacterium]|nr:glycosyltransferase family 4 protein [Actinomycetota bacterium]